MLGEMKQPKNSKRKSNSLDEDHKKRLVCLAEIEHRRLGEQIIHMMEFYLNHQIETKNMLEEHIRHQHETNINTPKFIKPSPKKKNEPQILKTSQILQEHKGFIISDVPDKKVKTEFENQHDI